ncbi:MAG: Tm-1-like ATP-binding domain-containing protein, partial [Desulfatiglandales bacterium]
MAVTVLIMGTLDTKAKELNYLRERIEAEGVQSLLMDVSCKAAPSASPSDISCNRVAKESGKDFDEIAKLDKTSAVNLVTEGAIKIVKSLFDERRIHAVIGLGGANGAEITCSVMRTLPIGFPKLMVTCVASGNVRPYVGTKDIMMSNSIGDISLNRITKRVIHNAARAIAHMANEEPCQDEEMRHQICMSTFGTTLPCVERAKSLLEEKGFEVIELHASGTGGMALEELVRSGEVSGVLDITTSELVDDLVDGMYSAGPRRLEAASAMGIPQVVSLGALDFGNFGAKETVPERYKDRNFFFYTPSITLMRTNVEENQ